jgi:tetratricopeptide (TPR) repeat protein
MRGYELYDRVVNWPGPMELTLAFGIGVAFIVLAATFLSMGRVRIFARALGILGVVSIMLALFVIHEQTEQEKIGEYVTVTRARYPEATRFQIRVALLGLPAAAAFVMLWGLSTTRRRLRSTVPDYLKEGRKLMIRGDLDAALAEYNRAIQISPYLGEAHFQRGCVYQAQGHLDEALADFDQALACDPQLVHAYLHRGRIRTEKGDLDAAMEDFEQVMIMRPNDAECYLHRGVCLARKGEIDDAILDFQRVLKLTNHSDYADPARYYLAQLGGENPLPPSFAGANGSPRASAPLPGTPAGQDYPV